MEVFMNIMGSLFGMPEHLFQYVGVCTLLSRREKRGMILYVCMYNWGKQKSRAEQEADRLRQLIQLLVGGKQFPHVQIHPLSHHHLSTLVITASSSNYLATRLGLFFFCRRTIVNAVPQAASYFSLLFLHYLYCENVKADIQRVCYS